MGKFRDSVVSQAGEQANAQMALIQEIALRAEHGATIASLTTHPLRPRANDQILQHTVRLEWRRLAREGGPLPTFDEVEFRLSSQGGEDGIIWFIFSLIGDGKKRSAEICCGDGLECCTANLAVNHGWECLMVDGNENLLNRGREYYRICGDTWFDKPKMYSGWITAENVNDVLREHDLFEDLDLLVLDVDGNDYWLWKALETRPRVVVVEYNASLGAEVSAVMPYDAKFVYTQDSLYHSASLRAYEQLAESLGYRLVGVNRYNFNAFFVRNDCGLDVLPAVQVDDCFTLPRLVRQLPELSHQILAKYEWLIQ